MEINDLPVLTIQEVDPEGTFSRGTVDRWQWVGEHYIAYLYLGDGCFLKGRFTDVCKGARQVTFVPKEPARVSEIKPGAKLRYLDGYWGERAILALDPLLQWHAVEFEPRDAIMHHWDGRTEEIPGGWDHEHCEICWATIDKMENHRYMLSDRNNRICCDCFTKYVQTRSIDFIGDER